MDRMAEREKRREKARMEQMEIFPADQGTYRVTGEKGRTYWVQPGAPRCSCADFTRNRWGTCKHLEALYLQMGERSGEIQPVFVDIETPRTFEDVGGRARMAQLGVSVVVTQVSGQEPRTYWAEDLKALETELRAAPLVIGYAIHSFDFPVLQGAGLNLDGVRSLDMMDAVQAGLGHRISLDDLTRSTLGRGKTGHGLQAVEWYRQGEMELLAEYCSMDVQLTRELFEWGVSKGEILSSRGACWVPWRYALLL